MDICERYHIRVIEDATEALGTKYETGRYAGKYAGTIGDFGAYSYNGNKIITTGGGGMLVARNEAEAEHIHYISTQAKDDTLFYIHNEVGYNYRMTNVQAALGVAQMEELPEFIQRKNYNYEGYRKKLEKFPYGQLLGFQPLVLFFADKRRGVGTVTVEGVHLPAAGCRSADQSYLGTDT